MGMYAVQADDSGELDALSTAARDGRATARLRRVALSQGKQALNGDNGRTAAGGGAGAPSGAENLYGNGAGAPPVASNGQGAANGGQGAPAGAAVGTNGAAGAAGALLGRAVSMQRRRQLSQGKQALNGDNGRTAAEGGAGAPSGAENLYGNGAGAPPVASNGQGSPDGGQGAPNGGAPGGTAVGTNGVTGAHAGRAVSMQRRRQLSQGKQALNGDGDRTVAAAGAGAPSGGQGAAGGTAAGTNGAAGALLGRAVSMQRRRQLSQGKQALNGDGDRTAAAAAAGAPPAAENLHVDGAGSGSGREQARARRAEASRLGSAGISRPPREGRVTHPPKVIVSPTQRDQRVTGLRIGPGVRVTGDEPGAALPVSGTQYVPADGSAPAMGAGPKVGRVRTPQGLVVSGTTVRGKVPITGDEFGEHLPITGEADQKLDDDLTPRSDGTYRPAQFPRRADPHGATAVGTRLGTQRGMASFSGDGPWLPLENSDGGLAVTGTAVGRSGRVTGNEAGACRPITGDQYQNLYSTECGGIGGGTAPAAHLNRGRLDPATAGKVTVAQTWGGQPVTGPSLEYRPNVTGDEPGDCRAVTGTPYQGPSTTFGWCEPDEAAAAAQRLEARPEGVAVTGDVPMYAKAVTGIERGHRNDITGSSYYGEMRPAEPAGDDEARWQAFSVPVALARRLAGGESDDAATQKTSDAVSPASCVPGRITGAFAVGEGKVTGNNEFLFRPRLNGDRKQPVAVTGEGRTDGRTITGSEAAWTTHDRVTGTWGYIAAGRNPTEGGGGPNGWAGARRFKNLATPGGPNESAKVTGRVGGSPRDAARVTVSGGARG
jgi:hypothetical protein